MSNRKYLEHILDRMKPGEHIQIDHYSFQKAYPCGWPSIYETHEEAFLSSRIGAAWGCWEVNTIPKNGNYVVSRHKESNKRYYVDPDRKHLFEKMPDGTYEFITKRST